MQPPSPSPAPSLPLLSPDFLEQQRSQKVSDDLIADHIASKEAPFRAQLQRVRADTRNDPTAITSFLNWKMYGDASGPKIYQDTPDLGDKIAGGLGSVVNFLDSGFLGTVLDYAGAPTRAIAGTIERGVNAVLPEESRPFSQASGFQDSPIGPLPPTAAGTLPEDLPKAARTIRTAAPIVASVATGGMSLLPAAGIVGATGAAGQTGIETADALTGQDDQSLAGRAGDVAIAGTLDALFEGGGILAGKALSKLAAPFKQSFNKNLKALYEKYGIRPTASMVSDSRVVPQVEALTKKSIFGGQYNDMLDEAVSQVEGVAQKLLDDVGATTDPTIAGNKIIEGATATKEAYLESRRKLYSLAERVMRTKDAQEIPFDGTKAVIEEFLQKKQGASKIAPEVSLIKYLKEFKENLNPTEKMLQDGLTQRRYKFQDVAAALDEIGSFMETKQGLLSTGDSARVGKIAATLKQEFESFIEIHAPEVYKALRAADFNAQLGYDMLNGVAGQVVQGLKKEPTKLVRALINPKSVDRIPSLYKMIGGENVPAVQGAFLKQILEDSSHPATGITGNKLQQTINTYGESTLKAALGPERLAALKDLQKMATGLQGARKIAEGSQTAFLARMTAISSTLFINPILTAQLLLGDAALSHLVASPAGIKWLTEGFAVPQAMQTGIRVGTQGLNQAAQSVLRNP